MYGMAPSLGIQFNTEGGPRSGVCLKIPPMSGTKESVQTLKDRFFTTHAPKLFNALPGWIRAEQESYESFKCFLDLFLQDVPDKPVLAGYHTPNWSRSGRQSNSIIDWLRNYPALVLDSEEPVDGENAIARDQFILN